MRNPTFSRTLLLVALILAACLAPAVAQPLPDGEDAYRQWAKNLNAFVRDVRFEEPDLASFLANWSDFNRIEDAGPASPGSLREMTEFSSILNHPTYQDWARARGIDAEAWLRKSMRILAMILRDEIRSNMTGSDAAVLEQMAELERVKTQFNAEASRTMQQALEEALAASRGTLSAAELLPVPTDTEQKLFEQYRLQLLALQ